MSNFEFVPAKEKWPKLRARFLFRQRKERAHAGDVQLTASQAYGVIAQSRYNELSDTRATAALAGTENFLHVDKDDFVISLRTFEGGIERAWERGCISPAYTVMKPSDRVDPTFFHHLLKSSAFIQTLQTAVTGIRDGKSVRYEQFADLVLPTPDIETQKDIADFLDRETARIDRLVEKKQRFIELQRERRFSEVSRLLTAGLDPKVTRKPSGLDWLPDIPAHWNWVRMKDVCTKIIDCKNRTPPEVDHSEFFVVRTSCIKDGAFDPTGGYYTDSASFAEWTKRGEPQQSDVLITREAPMGEACLVPVGHKLCLGQRMMLYRANPEKILPEYIVFTIYSAIGENYIGLRRKGSTVGHLRVPEVYNFPCLLPPLPDQRKIVKILTESSSSYGRLKDLVSSSIDRLSEFRSALITAAVTGQIDVMTWGKQGHTDRRLDQIEKDMALREARA